MITTGIIREVNISGQGYKSNLYKVEIPIFNSTSDPLNYTTIMETTACLSGGIYDCYSIGDYVYIGFINNKFNFPVILGKIYKGLDDNLSGSYNIQALKVANSASLPQNTKIGNIEYKDLLRAVTETANANNVNSLDNYQVQFSNTIQLTDKLHPDASITAQSSERVAIGKWVDGKTLYRQILKIETPISKNAPFSFSFPQPQEVSDIWWDTSHSYISKVGQPFYESSENNFILTQVNNDNGTATELIIKGQLLNIASTGKIIAVLLLTLNT